MAQIVTSLNGGDTRARCARVVARHGLQRVDIIVADLMIRDVTHVLSIFGSCAEIACRHLGVEL